ncbi:MAG: hypothetical protein JOZ51_02900 [Chloroflexi bacterium]|nr:hypothetical protein [Chloroflexota bacterium]
MNIATKHLSSAALALALVLGGTTLAQRYAAQPRTIHVDVSHVSDFSDTRKLAGFADNVFIGRVLEKTGTHSPDGVLPETLFKVDVIRSLKGSLSGTVAVNQQGGFSAEENAMILIEEDKLLETGKVYMFATRTGGDGAWQTLVPEFGDLHMGNGVQQVDVVQKFEKAVKEQVKYQP